MYTKVLFITLAAFFIRWIPRLIRPYALGSDTFYHLLCAESIRANRFRLPERIKGMILPGVYAYPYLYHWLLAIFPKKRRDMVEPISSPFFDAIMIAVAMLFAEHWAMKMGVENSQQFTVLLGLFMATSPALLNVSIGPRAYQGTARTLGELLFVIFMLCTYYYLYSQSSVWLIGVLLSGAMVLLSSKFGAQVVIFLLVTMSILSGNMVLLLFPFAIFLSALLVSGGSYWVIFKNHTSHLFLYARSLMHLHTAVKTVNSWAVVKELGKAIVKGDWRQSVDILLHRITLTAALVRYPQALIAGYCLFTFGFPDRVVQHWFVASGVIFILVSLRPLRFLGEADRYLEYSLVAQYLIIVFVIPQEILMYLLIVQTALAALFVAQFVYMNRGFNKQQQKDKKECWENLQSYCLYGPVATILGVRPNEVGYETGCTILNTEYFTKEYYSAGEMKYLFVEYPYWSYVKFLEILERYKCGSVLVKKEALDYAVTKGWHYPLDRLKKVWENRSYEIYLVNNV